MKFSDVEIRVTGCDYDMAPWHYEKSLSVVESLAGIIDELKTNKIGEDIPIYLYPAIANATKLLAFSCASLWDTDDPKLIIENGFSGVEKILVKYGVLEQTDEEKEQRYIQLHALNILSLLESEMAYESRTEIHEILAKVNSTDMAWESIKNLTESLTMNEIEWKEYRSKVNGSLGLILKEI